ncbi:hypothetical protein [Streptosporangium minutum]|uniref:hypothetical protein n=1 Tax=Streptosporangium minutum TaxID=569862 RepID=UPI001055574A|nr:hypothetical protein [Streptosporangium minutum]
MSSTRTASDVKEPGRLVSSSLAVPMRKATWSSGGEDQAEVGVEDGEGLDAGVDAEQEGPTEALDDPDQMASGAEARSSVVCFDRVLQKAIRTPS